MIERRLLTGLVLLCLSCSAYSQEYSYTHYDISDGLAGSVVYCITQDKDGFIWTGTETGVSRFDGTHFKTFTVADGLPDIEVLQLFGDSKGRVWMAPFRKSVCYYYKGRIYNQDNDSLLHAIRLRENVENFAEDAEGNILIQEQTALQWLGADGTLRQFDSIGGQPIRQCAAVCRSASGHFLVQEGQQVFSFSRSATAPYMAIPLRDVATPYVAMNAQAMIWRMDMDHSAIRSFITGRTVQLPFERAHYNHLSYTIIGDSLFYFNGMSGTVEYNLRSGEEKRFLPGTAVSRTFRDSMGNTWFTTIGQGIYRLNSDEFKTLGVKAPGMNGSSICCIRKIDDRLWVGDDHSYIYSFAQPDMTLRSESTCRPTAKNRILYLSRDSTRRQIYMASDIGFSTVCSNYPKPVELGVKTVFEKDSSELLVSASSGVYRFDLRRFRITDTLWRERSTTLYYRRDTLYIGTLNGLYILAPHRSAYFPGKTIPFLQKRISAIVESPDHTLWIASYDAGVIGWKDGRIIAGLGKRNGLTSDICRTMLLKDNILWIGTDKGLNKVRLDDPRYPVTQYTSKDGLGADIINTIYADGSMIYVGTPAGLSYFDQAKVNLSEGCRLYLLAIQNGGRDRLADSAQLVIPYQDKQLHLEFAGISYRSVGSILYQYRLIGLDTGWRQTKESFLDYPTLPSGKYTLQLRAINKFGISSALLSVPFEVLTPFWQTSWFDALVVIGFLALTYFFVSLRIKQIRRQESERKNLNQRLTEMEHIALQAQMNPHFIFNCLNSIQQYIFNQDSLEANKYLTGFARLIRSTLHNSSRPFITLAAEIDYLSTYLSLEKLRFKEKMDYRIEVDPVIDIQQYLIPPMLIQPFVENAMRHGLRHKTDGKGYIYIGIVLASGKMVVTVEDNGIGRRKAATYKTREHIEYQSRGMSLTADRIRLMNVKYKNGIRIDVTDLENDTGKGCGTRVVMQFGLFHLTDQNETPYDPNSARG
jgi:ligand-binding sensor domain-containing protein